MTASAFLPCAILVPSLNRAHRLADLFANIQATTPEDHLVLFCVGDPDSVATCDALDVDYIDDSDSDDKRYVTRMNKMVQVLRERAPFTKSVFFASDDIKFYPGWLSEALFWMERGAAVVVVNDLRNPNGTQAVVRMDYLDHAVFDEPGNAFYSGYHHNFADTEMFFTADARGLMMRAMDSFVEHLHPLFGQPGSADWDSTYRDGAMAHIDDDRQRYEERMARLLSEMGVAT